MTFFFLDHGTSPPAAMYETYYVTAHKAPCRTASFSQNGMIKSYTFFSLHCVSVHARFSLF